MSNPSKLFVSHSSSDKAQVWAIVEQLMAVGVDLWVDALEMRPGTPLIRTITDAIGDAAYVAAMLSAESVKSQWVQEELKQAMAHEFHGGAVKVIPCLLDKSERPIFLRDKYYCDFTSNGMDGLVGLLRGIYPSSHVIGLSLDGGSPFQIDGARLLAELEHVFRFHQGVVDLIFVLDVHALREELGAVWRREPDATDNLGNTQRRKTAALILTNMGYALTHVAALEQSYGGRSASVADRIVSLVQRVALRVLHDFWRLVAAATSQSALAALQSANGRAVLDRLEQIRVAGQGSNRMPAPVLEAELGDCAIPDLLDVGMQGRGDVCDVRLFLPKKAIPNDTIVQMGQRLGPLSPGTEIFRDQWMRYFVPSIVGSHVLECSDSGQYLGRLKGKFSIKREDYRHIGYS